MNLDVRELGVTCNDRGCIAGEHLELIANLMLDMGIAEVYEYPVYRNQHDGNLCMVKLADGTCKEVDVNEKMLSRYGALFFADPVTFPRKDEETLGRQVPLAQPGQKTHLGCRSPEPLLWFLLDLGLDVADIRNCWLRKDSRNEYWVLRLDQISDWKQRSGDFEAHVDRLASVFYVAPFECGPRDLTTMADVIGDLSPARVATGLPYSTLVFWCVDADKFRSVLDMLFRLGVRRIHAAKLQERGHQVYLVRAVDIESPIVLSRFGRDTGVHIFYSLPSSTDIWIEWGWEYALPDFSYHKIFSSGLGRTAFLFGDGTKAHVEQPEYNRLLRFLDLHIDPNSTLQLLPVSRRFKENEFRYCLRLTRDTWQNRGRRELEELLRQEKEIRDRIDWLREIEGIVEGYTSHRVLFYRLSRSRKDPAFPSYFFRQQTFSELRKLAYYYGNVGKLGDGVLVSSKHFVDGLDSGGYEMSDKVYPRDGMVFESCADWAKLTGLRVLRPRGLDLFPYLEVDQADRNKIRDALLERVIVRHADGGCDLRLMTASDSNPEDELIHKFKMEFESKKNQCAVLIVRTTCDSDSWTIAGFNDAGEFRTKVLDNPQHELWKELNNEPHEEKSRIIKLALSSLGRTPSRDFKISKAEEEDIRVNPQRYLFFLYRAKDEEFSELEGFVLRDDKFKEFELKIANMGVFFSQTDEEREIATKSYAESVERHYTSAFDNSMVKLHDDLEHAFQTERVVVKQEIEQFSRDLSEKLKALAAKKSEMNELVRSIESKETTLKKYDKFLTNSRRKYNKLTRNMSRELLGFTTDIERIISRVVADYTVMVDEKFKTLDGEIKTLEKFRDFRTRMTSALLELTAKKNDYERALSSLTSANAWLETKQDQINESSLTEEVKDLWILDDAFRLASDSLNKIEYHLDSTRSMSSQSFSGLSEEQNRWANLIIRKANIVQEKLPNFLGDDDGKQAIKDHFENLAEALRIVEEWTREKTKNHIDNNTLRRYQQEINELVRNSVQRLAYKNIQNLPRTKRSRSLLDRLLPWRYRG